MEKVSLTAVSVESGATLLLHGSLEALVYFLESQSSLWGRRRVVTLRNRFC
jgi:hypothetical protein